MESEGIPDLEELVKAEEGGGGCAEEGEQDQAQGVGDQIVVEDFQPLQVDEGLKEPWKRIIVRACRRSGSVRHCRRRRR